MASEVDISDALLELEQDVPQTFTWNGQEWPCIATGRNQSGKLEAFGVALTNDLTIVVRKSVFGTGPYPSKKQSLTFSTISYRIENVITSPLDCFVKLTCVDDSRGA